MIRTKPISRPARAAKSTHSAAAAFLGGIGGLLCSLAALPFGLHPFGIAAAALLTDSLPLNIGLPVGAVIGALLLGENFFFPFAGILFAVSARYLLSALLRRRSRRLISALAAAGGLILAQVLSASASGFLAFDILTGLLAIFAGVLFCLLAHTAAAPLALSRRNKGLSQSESAALLVCICILLLPLCSLSLYGLSPACLLGALLTLFAGAVAGATLGGMSGALLATTLALTGAAPVHIIGVYAVGGIAAGLCGKSRKLPCIGLFLLCTGLLSFAFDRTSATLALLSETGAACLIFFFLPARLLTAASHAFAIRPAEPVLSDRHLTYLRQKLETAGTHLDGISRALAPAPAETEADDLPASLKRAAETVCRNCSRSTLCWSEYYNDSADALSKAEAILRERTLFSEDLPDYFRRRCTRLPALIPFLNDAGERARDAFLARVEQSRSRAVMAAQYASLSQYLSDLCADFDTPLQTDELLSRRAEEYLTSRGFPLLSLFVYRTEDEGLRLQALTRSKTPPTDRQVLSDLSRLCGVRLTVLECERAREGWLVTLGRREAYKLSYAAKSLPKSGEAVCGDMAVKFRSRPYKRCICLADGMGCGNAANAQAALACELIEGVMKSGFLPEKALRLLNSTLLLTADCGTFSTLDLAEFDLAAGRVDLYKFGAASTLVVRDGRPYEIPCSSLPAGLLTSAAPEHRYFSLRPGDLILMRSDGVELDEETTAFLCHGADAPLSTLCDSLLARRRAEYPDDDKTVLCMRIEEN